MYFFNLIISGGPELFFVAVLWIIIHCTLKSDLRVSWPPFCYLFYKQRTTNPYKQDKVLAKGQFFNSPAGPSLSLAFNPSGLTPVIKSNRPDFRALLFGSVQKAGFLLGIFVFLSFSNIQAATKTSTGTGGNWSAAATWVGGAVPASGDDVTISAGASVIIDTAPTVGSLLISGTLEFEATTARSITVLTQVTISSRGVFRSAQSGTVKNHQLIVEGSIINDGILDFSSNSNATGVEIVFTGSSNAIFSCSDAPLTNLKQTNGITLNKGTSAASVLSFTPGDTFQVLSDGSSGAKGFLTVVNGTFNIIGSNRFSNPVFNTEGDYTIPSTGGFWLGNQNATVIGMNGKVTNLGELKITNGTYDVGISGGSSLETLAEGQFKMSGGTLTIAGNFKMDGGHANISGGRINLATQANSADQLPTLSMSGRTNIELYGTPVITIAYPNSKTVPVNDIQIGLGGGRKSVTGGTIQLGTEATPSGSSFFVNGDPILDRLTVLNECTILVFNTSKSDLATTPISALPKIAFDKIAPELTAPPKLAIQCGENLPKAYASLQEFTNAGGAATDNCTFVPASFKLRGQVQSNANCPYTITRTYEVSDVSGNMGTAQHLIVVEGVGTEPPPEAIAESPVKEELKLKSAMGIQAVFQAFTTSSTFSVPAGVRVITVECWGGGGGGGNASHGGNGSSRGGGGAGGAYSIKTISGVSGNYTVTVGAGGTGGNSGNPSWFGAVGTVYAQGGARGNPGNNTNGTGGTGSSASSIGDLVYAGGSGGAASAANGSGGGGGGAGSTGVGNGATNNTPGGAKANNGGAGGAGITTTANGNPGNIYGAGGSGAVATNNNGSQTGGTGAPGYVYISFPCINSLTSALGTDNQSKCLNNAITSITYLLSGDGITGATVLPLPTGVTSSFNSSTGVVTISGTPTQAGTFNYIVTPTGGCATNTSTGTITVNPLPVITLHPANQTDCEGAIVTFSVTATGSGLSYTWQRKKPADASFTDIPGGAPNVTYPVAGEIRLTNIGNSDAPSGTQYRVVISNGSCSVTSNAATLTVNEITDVIPSVSIPLKTDVIICNGSNFNYQVTTSQPANVVSYQWKKWILPGSWVNVSDGGAISGSNSSQLTFTGATASESGEYKVTVTFDATGADCNVTSDTRTRKLTVLDPVNASVVSGTLTICYNTVPSQLSATSATGGSVTPSFTYQWQNSPNNSIYTNIGGATSLSYQPPALTASTYYRIIATDAGAYACGTATSNSVMVTVNPQPTLATATQAASVCAGNPATINLTGLVTGTTFSLDYTINGVAQTQKTGLVADASGNSSFTTPNLTAANNGQTLQITGITITSSTPNCPKTFAQDVTLIVNTPPVITCPVAPVIQNTSATDCTVPASYSVTSTGQPAATYTYTVSGATTANGSGTGSGTTLNVGTNFVSVTATNSCGSSACSFQVIVYDNIKPVISNCPANISVNNDIGDCGAKVNWTAPGVSDNCSGGLTLTSDHNSGDFFPVGTTTVTYTATDASGNKSYCLFAVLVSNVENPVITCPTNISVNNAAGTCGASVNPGMATATANCSASPVITWTRSDGKTSLTADPYPVGVTTITWKATAGTQSSTCVQTISVTDTEAPTFTAPGAYSGSTGVGCVAVTTPGTTGNVTILNDNCTQAGSLSVTYTDATVTSTTCPSGYTITRLWKVTDASGNSSTATQTITITDSTPPLWSVSPGNKTISCSASIDPSSTGMPTATDNCGLATITYTDSRVNGLCAGSAVITRTWVAIDLCGNRTTDTQTITLVDTTPPVINCPATFTVATPSDIPVVSVTLATLTATDNCTASPTIEFVSESFTGLGAKAGFCPTSVTRIFRAIDACGNTSTCSVTINVADVTNCGPCQNGTVPNNLVDLSSSPTAVRTIYNVNRFKNGYCCNVGQDNCISFNILLHPDAIGVVITVAKGAAPSPQDWDIDCNDVDISNDQICVKGDGVTYHLFTYCKPGNNENDYIFTSITGASNPQGGQITTRVDCAGQLQVTGVVSPTWTSISPGAPGDYNKYLFATPTGLPGSGVSSTNPYFIGDALAPTQVIYQVCGTLTSTNCDGVTSDCTTVTVNVRPKLIPTLNINPGNVCDLTSTVLQVTMNPPGTYTYQWWKNAVGFGTPVTSPTFTPTSEGNYVVLVTETVSGIICNTTSLTFTVELDKTGPTVSAPPAPLTLQCNDPLAAQQITNWLNSATASYTAADGTTNTFTPTNNYTGIAMTCGTVLEVLFSATDQCSNTTTISSTITVIDTSTPTWTTPAGSLDRSFECSDVAGLASANTLSPTATDVCDPTLTITKTSGSFVPGSCANSGTYSNTWTATDDCGNVTSIFTQVITITDTQAPTWNTLAGDLDRTVACFDAVGLAAAQTLSPTATDACGVVTLTKTSGAFVPGSCPTSGTYTNIWTARDACGNVSGTYTQVITQTDTQGPIITGTLNPINASGCSVADAPAAVTTVAALEGMGVAISDLCTPDGTLSVTSTDLAPVGSCPAVVTRTYMVTDVCGNVSTVTQTINLGDTTAPVITGSLPLTTLEGCTATDVTTAVTTVAELVALGLTISDTCTPNGTLSVTHSDSAPSGSCPIVVTRTYSVADACGNTSTITQIFRVGDTTPPVITGTLSVTTLEGCTATSVTAAVTTVAALEALGLDINDSCTSDGTLSVTSTDSSSGTCPVVVTRTYTVTDICGNSSTITQTFNIDDTTPPAITCPGPYYQNANPNTCIAFPVNFGTATVTDSCGGTVSITNNAPAQFPVGVTTITWTATDDCGNVSTCEQYVTIYDIQAPVIDCTTTVINATVGPGQCTVAVGLITPTYTENCNANGAPTVTITRSDGLPASANFPVGTTTVVWTVADIYNNFATCTQTVIVTDNIAPTITCPTDVVATAPTATCQMLVTPIGAPTIDDNCGTYTLTWTKLGATTGSGIGDVNNTMFNGGVTSVTYTVTDAAGNSASCSFTVTVNDQVPPTITNCPPNVLETSLTDLCEFTVTAVPQPTAIDPCGSIVSMTHNSPYATNSSTTDASGIYPVGTTTITWTVTDNAGNIATCVQLVTVTDRQLPELDCPDDETYAADFAVAYKLNVPINLPTFSDNCPGAWLTWTMGGATTDTSTNTTGFSTVPTPYPQLNVGNTVITYTITDVSGQTVSCSFTITIVSAPEISCPASITTYTASNNCGADLDPGIPTLIQGAQPITWTWTIDSPISADVSGISTSTVSDPLPDPIGIFTFDHGTTTITWSATNISGTDSCTQTVTVIDNIPPIYTPPPTDVEYCVESIISAIYDPTDPINNLIVNPDPDYYLFRTGVNSDTTLDLNVVNLTDNCCPGTTTWTITFSPVPDPNNGGSPITYPPVSGTGQPSAYPSSIQIWGDGVNYIDVVHKIDYTVTDCHGNSTTFKRDITVKPRPKIVKMP